MSETGGDQGPNAPRKEEAIVSDFAESAVSSLRKGARSYPEIRRLLQHRTFSIDEPMMPTELNGSHFKYTFTRHARRYIDLEVKKTPAIAGGDFIEQSVRLRTKVDPLVRTAKTTQSKGVERSENDDNAYSEINSFVEDLLPLF